MVNTFTLNTTDPQFETGRRHKPSLKGSRANVISGLVLNLEKWKSCIRKSIQCPSIRNKGAAKSALFYFRLSWTVYLSKFQQASGFYFSCIWLFGDYTLYKIWYKTPPSINFNLIFIKLTPPKREIKCPFLIKHIVWDGTGVSESSLELLMLLGLPLIYWPFLLYSCVFPLYVFIHHCYISFNN